MPAVVSAAAAVVLTATVFAAAALAVIGARVTALTSALAPCLPPDGARVKTILPKAPHTGASCMLVRNPHRIAPELTIMALW